MTSTTKVRRWLSALCIVLLVPGPLTTSFLSARQGCADCTAVSLGNGWRVDNMGTGAEVGVCFGGGFSAHELSGFKAGFDYWTTYFATNSQFPKRDFNYTNPGSCNITVVKYGGLPSSTVANAAGKSDGSPAVIHINENRLVSSNGWQSTNYWGWAMAEEVGHLQDFDHFSGNCSGKTVMRGVMPSDSVQNPAPSLPTAALCSDQVAATNKYLGETTGGGYEEPEDEEQGSMMCTSYYWVVEHYYWHIEYGWVHYRTERVFSHVDYGSCYPLND